jgi:hypothetical protein
VLTKFYNGMDMAFKCPPLVRLKQTPRISALQTLGEKMLKQEKERDGILIISSNFQVPIKFFKSVKISFYFVLELAI